MADSTASAAPADRMKMIRAMVDGLAARLEADQGDLDGWLRLARADKVLGENAKSAAAKARAAKLVEAMPNGTPQRMDAERRLKAAED